MPLNAGTYISGIGHIALIFWVLVGGLFLRSDDPLPVQTTEVSLMTGEEFAALTAPQEAPAVSAQDPEVQQPEPADTAPELDPTEETPPQIDEPAEVTPANPEEAPEQPELQPLPPVEIEPDAPESPEPPAPDSAAVIDPQSDDAPTPTPAPRVAPTPTPEPAPDAAIADTATPEVAPDDTADTPAEEQPETAPEQAATEIVTEAEQPAAAPAASMRPKSRPVRTAVAQPETPDEPKSDPIADAVAAAVADTPSDAPSTPTGPPLSFGEKDALRVAVSRCWNTGALSSEALQTTVVIAVTLSRDGKPNIASIRMLSSEGGNETSVSKAYQAGRRAIIVCGANGFNLPSDKYSHWQDIEMTFNPEKMRIK